MAAHYWGAKEKKKTKEVFTLSFLLSAGLSLFFALITLASPGGIMRLFTDDEAVAASGISYLRITAFVYFFHGTSLVTTMMMRTVGQQKLGLYVSIISFGINIFANWVFIFGKLGAPEMGIAGAALGTLISRVVEFVVTFWFVLRADRKLKMRIRDYRKLPSAEVLHQYMRIGAAVLISEGLLGFGSTALSMILGRMGTDVVVANSICMVLDRLVVVIVNGISQASSILVGHTIGEGKKQEAQLQGETFLILGILY